jgi:hypothetical protein
MRPKGARGTVDVRGSSGVRRCAPFYAAEAVAVLCLAGNQALTIGEYEHDQVGVIDLSLDIGSRRGLPRSQGSTTRSGADVEDENAARGAKSKRGALSSSGLRGKVRV